MYTGSAAKYNRIDHGLSSPLATAYYEPIKRTAAAAGGPGSTASAAAVYTPERRQADFDNDYSALKSPSPAKVSFQYDQPHGYDRGVLSASRYGGESAFSDHHYRRGAVPSTMGEDRRRGLDESFGNSAISQGDQLIAAKQKRMMSAQAGRPRRADEEQKINEYNLYM